MSTKGLPEIWALGQDQQGQLAASVTLQSHAAGPEQKGSAGSHTRINTVPGSCPTYICKEYGPSFSGDPRRGEGGEWGGELTEQAKSENGQSL